MILDTTSKLLQIVLGSGVTTRQLQCTSNWADYAGGTPSITPGSTQILTSDTSPVTVVGSPGASTQRVVSEIWVYNADTVAATIILQLFDGASTWIIEEVSVTPGNSFHYTPNVGPMGNTGPIGASGPVGPTGPIGPPNFPAAMLISTVGSF